MSDNSKLYGDNIDAFKNSLLDHLKPVGFVKDFFHGIKEGYDQVEIDDEPVLTDDEYEALKDEYSELGFKKEVEDELEDRKKMKEEVGKLIHDYSKDHNKGLVDSNPYVKNPLDLNKIYENAFNKKERESERKYGFERNEFEDLKDEFKKMGYGEDYPVLGKN